VIERLVDEIARAVGREPNEVRFLNLVRPEQMPFTTIGGMRLDSGDYAQSVRLCAELLDMPAIRARQQPGEPDGRLIGVGFASFYEQTAYGTGPFGYSAWGIELVPGMEPAVARLTGDGELVLEVGSHSHGQGHETVFAQVAHEVLGIEPRKIAVRFGDTSTSPAGTGTYTSRSMVTTGGAIADQHDRNVGQHHAEGRACHDRVELLETGGKPDGCDLRLVADLGETDDHG